MSRPSLFQRLLSLLVLFGLVLTAYLFLVRPRQLRWGAHDVELSRPMPGDDLVADPTFDATRAVTVEGSPEEIWPWLVQIGYGRAGFYGYDMIENLGSPRGIRSAERIIPELQELEIGDRIHLSPVAYQVVHSLDPNRFLVWSDDSDPPSSAFTWALYPVDENRTRLVSRVRLRYHWAGPWMLVELFTDFADHVAVRKILLGVKDRVEGRVEPMARQNAEIVLWGGALLGFLAAIGSIFLRQAWWRGWLVALAASSVLLLTLYAQPPLWISALAEGVVLAGLLWAYRSAPDRAR